MKPEPVRYTVRRITDAVMSIACAGAAIIGITALALILYMVFSKGMSALGFSTFTEPMASPGSGGGLANAIVGTLIQTGIGTLIGAPTGVLVGVYLSEFGKESAIAHVVRFFNDILLSAPSVLIGLFIYQLVVAPMHGFSGLAGAIALALLAMPVVARTTEDILKLVPQSLRDAAVALGSRDHEIVRKVVLPAAAGGILTGVLLAVARISGETAPLIFTSLGNSNWSFDLDKPMASLPIAIYQYAGSPYQDWVSMAWSGALIITVGVLALNIASRVAHRLTSAR